MKKLIIFEFRKIFTKRIMPIGIIALLLLNISFITSTCQSMYTFDGKSKEGAGMDAIQLDKEIAEKYQGVLTDEKVQQMLQDFRPTVDLRGMNVAYLYKNAIQSAVHTSFADQNGNWNGLTVSDVYGNEEIQIGYINGWLNVSQYMVRIFFVLALLVILMIAPVFSGEYGSVDSLILTTQYGKTRCTTAKVVASFGSAFLVTSFFSLINIIAALIIYGSEGLNSSILFAPVSFSETYIPFNITCGTLIKYQILLAFACVLALVGITLLLSAVCKNQIVALVASLVVFVLPLILNVPESNPIYKLLVLMPVYYAQFISIMSVEQMSSGMLYTIWAVPVSVILAVLGAYISRWIFAKHQVS